MALKQTKELKTAKFFLFLALYLFTATILYIFLGHQLIKLMYAGKLFGFLNRVIAFPHVYPLKHYFEVADKIFFNILFSAPIFLFFFVTIFKYKLNPPWLIKKRQLQNYSDTIDALPSAHTGLWIALASGLSLYMELMLIRFHSSCFPVFAYFKNISLLSCFLGLGIGYTKGKEHPLSLPFALPFLGLQIILMHILRFSPLQSYLLNPISEQLTLGIGTADDVLKVIFSYTFITLIFSFNALCFIPFGQLVSRLMLRKSNLKAYAWNLTGGLSGILVFSILSFLWTPPLVWFILATVLLAIFFYKNPITFIPSAVTFSIVLLFLAAPSRLTGFDIYSPYQIVSLVIGKGKLPTLEVNNAYYLKIVNLNNASTKNNEKMKKWAKYYELPYSFKPEPKNVLIVGSGAGNDTAAALRSGAKDIDAVEIDPAILEFGKQLHPESPYQAANVNTHTTDARTFIRYTHKQYDLIVYGLVTSHVLLSSRGGIRLDSYIYTTEAFREARSKLKKDGIISFSFFLLSKELGRKLFLMLEETFDGQSPLVYQVGYDGGYTFLCGDKIRHSTLRFSMPFKDVTSEFTDNKIRVDKSTDDWPFFYMPIKKYPFSYVVMILLLFSVSILFIRRYVSGFKKDFSATCFLLGAGFMLLETKAITELALFYGSTWIVTSVVIAAVLLMAFLANSFAMKRRTSPLLIYGLLLLSLMAGLATTFLNLNYLAPWLPRIGVAVILTLPLFFSGLAFSAELKKDISISAALSSNLLGAMLGGFIEYNSMYFGYRALYLIAFIIYAFALITSLRTKLKE